MLENVIGILSILFLVGFCAFSFRAWLEGTRQAELREAERKKKLAEEEAERQRREQEEEARRQRERAREKKRRAEEEARRQEAIDALKARIAIAEAAFLERYEDFDEEDPRESKKSLSKEGVALSDLYLELANFYPTLEVEHYLHLEQSYKTLLKALSVLPTRTRVRVLALERGRALASCGRNLQDADGRVTIYDEAAIQNDLNAYGGMASES